MASWREVSLDDVNITIALARSLLFDSVTLEDNPLERDEGELEYWYPRWKLLGLSMHGLYHLSEFPGDYELENKYKDFPDFIALSIDNLNSLFGFCDKETGKAMHSKDLWEEGVPPPRHPREYLRPRFRLTADLVGGPAARGADERPRARPGPTLHRQGRRDRVRRREATNSSSGSTGQQRVPKGTG